MRKPEQLDNLRGLVIPGGESTTMALVAERWGLVRRRAAEGGGSSPPRHVWRGGAANTRAPPDDGGTPRGTLSHSADPCAARVCRQRSAHLGHVRRPHLPGGPRRRCDPRCPHARAGPRRALTRYLRVPGQKQGGQALIGGLDITVSRNFFGSQIESFETLLAPPPALPAVDGCALQRLHAVCVLLRLDSAQLCAG